MFRAAAPGPYDEAIAKATDENLTSEDWAAIMEVCDRVSSDTNGSQQAVQALIKRLAHRNANVQLYTLELANALSQNCGKPMHRELASRAFTDALLKLANDRNTHNQVKAKIMERMKDWSDMFSKDADLGIMYDAYYRLKQSNPQLQPPSAPQKTGLTDLDRQKEEDELQIALKLSLQEEERKKQKPATAAAVAGPSNSAAAVPQESAAPVQQPMPSGTTAATVSRVRALYDFVPSEPGELEFKRGDVIAVLESVYKDWWRGSLKGKTGIFPLNYVEKLTDPTPEELQREAQMEAEVFAEIKNVEKLLTLLSTNSAPREEDNEEISKLYHQTLSIRPKLIKLIEKYSQKKDDFTQLNEKFIKARRDYEALLESSMSHPPQPTYQQYAMRPAMPQGYSGPAGPGYPTSGPQDPHAYGAPGGVPSYPPQQGSQDPQRIYSPPPQQEPPHQQYTSYPPSQQQHPIQAANYPRPGATPAPFYVAGAEVPASQNYPQLDQGGHGPSAGTPQVEPIQTTTSPPPVNQYMTYSRPSISTNASQPAPSGPNNQPRPQPSYSAFRPGGPQSQQPSPPHPQQQQQQHHHAYNARPQSYMPSLNTQAANSSPPQPQHHQQQMPQNAQPPQNPQELATSVYDSPIAPHNPHSPTFSRPSAYSSEIPTPSAPSYPAPSVPDGMGSVSVGTAPSPLHPSGPAYDARQGLPSQMSGGGGDGVDGGGSSYKAYIPPNQAY
ncbi:hypothetical protein BD289DRAFT_421389 [Coniella lustricola]|uniref:Class E vacuolar protein-sorting machinery protein HSE1 n=1 Tax=Coniella lustricola TaxID=2025994 RepID=A0A2T3AM84_9PEZI|nr:hypothetical protein BD289DRAFT_421389 [Coniella lustricola]